VKQAWVAVYTVLAATMQEGMREVDVLPAGHTALAA
jgi:hypothetical protein